MAERSKLSASHLSQIEQDKSLPSLTTLTSIAQVLAINPRDLFESEEGQVYISRASDRLEVDDANAPLVSSRLTTPVRGWNIEVHRLVLQPGAPPLEFESYPGEVLGFVLAGTLKIVLEGEEIELEVGDSIHCDADQPYCLSCHSPHSCIILWCNSPPRDDLDSKIEAVWRGKTRYRV